MLPASALLVLLVCSELGHEPAELSNGMPDGLLPLLLDPAVGNALDTPPEDVPLAATATDAANARPLM